MISYLCLVGWCDYVICSWISEVFWLKNTQINSYQFMDLNIHQNTKI
ncbi:pyrazinamidase/nicotinamidase [Helicobacter pylori]|nr:pyrazinamidase/nicotinamidase [Helicobacter pylori]